MQNKQLLLVEDDANLGQVLTEYLTIKGFSTVLCTHGKEGLEVFKTQPFDCCLLDIMMPKMDGFTLAKEIRKLNPDIPFLFLTAKSMQHDKLTGFKLGAEDYITKPFSMEELLLRLQVIFRRTHRLDTTQPQIYTLGGFTFDTQNQEIRQHKTTIKLTTKEADLLLLLCQNKNKTLDRKAALQIIWGSDSYFNARSMDVYIAKLRKHLKPDPSVKIITIHGLGFRLVVN